MILRSLTLVFALSLFSCGSEEYLSQIDSSAPKTITGDSIDTIITFDRYRYNIINVQIRKNDSVISSSVFRMDSDTTFFPDGTIKNVHELPSNENDEKHIEYYLNGAIKYEFRDRNIGNGNESMEWIYYDSLGAIDSVISSVDYLPENARTTLDQCGIVTYKYYSKGKLHEVRKYDEHYEGLHRCPCGTWEYYDGDGKLINKETYKKCGDGETDCEQM